MKYIFFLCTFLFLLPSLFAQPIPPEFAVSEVNINYRYDSQVDTDQNGNFVVVWEREYNIEEYLVEGQRFSSNGAAIGSVFTVDNDNFGEPAIAVHSDGSFVVVWSGEEVQGIYARRYDDIGDPIRGAFREDTEIIAGNDYEEDNPDIAMDENGNFVVVWERGNFTTSDYDIRAQRFDNNGNKIGSEFNVNTNTNGFKRNPAIAMDSDGDFVVTWESNQIILTSSDIYAQYYKEDGTTIGSEFLVNTFVTDNQNDPTVAMNSNGDYTVVWSSLNQDGSGRGIFGQRYNDRNQVVDNEFQVNTYTTDDQVHPAIDMDNEGNFVVVWQSNGQDGDGSGVYGQEYNANGDMIDSEFSVNVSTANAQGFPAVAMDQDCDFVVTWDTYDLGFGSFRILGRQFDSGSDFPVTCYLDADGDGFGNPASSLTFCGSCGNGYVDNDYDCNDDPNNGGARMGAGNSEIPNDGIDNDCDGMIDEDALSLRPCNAPTLIDFSGFDGSGVAFIPDGSQLSTQEWSFIGFGATDGDAPFGSNNTSPNFARGTTNGSGVNQIFEGIYALDVLGNQALWIQPGSDVFEPGSMTLRICNYSGSTVNEVDLSYDILVLNNTDRTNYFNFSYSTDDVTYTPVSSLDYASPLNATANGLEIIPRSTTLMGLNLADGECLYLRWTGGTEFSFDGERDELGIDDISICSPDLPDLPECEGDDLILSTTISDMQEHNAANTITADNEITATADVIYTAGDSIVLEAGFEVAAGGEFHAYIAECVDDPMPENRTKPIENTASPSLSIYPNPAREIAQVLIDLPKATTIHLQLFDLNGRAVKSIKTEQLTVGKHKRSIPLDNLPTGMYYLNLRYNSGVLSEKLLIVKD